MRVKICFVLVLLSSLALNLVHAKVYTPKKQVLISVGDLKDKNNYQWKKETCNSIYALANQIIETGVDVTCRRFDTGDFVEKNIELKLEPFDYHIRIIKGTDDIVGVDVTKLKRIHKSDFSTLGWRFKDGTNTKISKEDAMAKAIGNFFFYVENETAYKAGLLVNGVHESSSIEYDKERGVFVDLFSGQPISIDAAYSLFETESNRKNSYLRAGIEIGVMLSSGMAIYYKNLGYNQVDFDYGLKDGLRKKLNGQAVLYDDNDKFANYGHAYAGAIYYQAARTAGFNSLESFLVTLGTSTAWEVLEYHEVLSINDQYFTVLGGYVIGEATYQISCALVQKNNIAAKALGYTLSPSLGINHGADKLFSKNKFIAHQSDCSRPRWSDISFYIGLEKGQKAYQPQANDTKIIGTGRRGKNISERKE